MAVLGFHCCLGFSLLAAGGGYSLGAVHRLLLQWLLLLQSALGHSVVTAHGIQ